MARKVMVTRTIKGTKVNVLFLNVVSAEPFNKDINVSGVYKDNEKLLKHLKSVYDTDDEKVVAITYTEVFENLLRKLINNGLNLPLYHK